MVSLTWYELIAWPSKNLSGHNIIWISRLLYSIQACSLTEKELDTIEVIWNGFLRKMVKGGYQRINTPTNKEKQTTTDKEVDWRYRISNDKSEADN